MKHPFYPVVFAACAIASAPAAAADRPPFSNAAFCVGGAVAPEAVKDIIRSESERQGVDARLALAISDQESGFGRNVNSSAGARGPMQLMPETAARYGVVDICDAGQNIRGGVAYLKDLGRLFGGNIFLMVAAYNAGEERIFRSGGVPAIAETVNYTAMVTNAYYGFDNILKGGRRRPGEAATADHPSEVETGVDLMTTGSVSEKPIPINQNRTGTSAPTWIGGSVLYVQ